MYLCRHVPAHRMNALSGMNEFFRIRNQGKILLAFFAFCLFAFFIAFLRSPIVFLAPPPQCRAIEALYCEDKAPAPDLCYLCRLFCFEQANI